MRDYSCRMKLSIYTFVKDGLYYDFHVVAMIRQHLPFVDEIVVNEGYSTDGTFEAIQNLDPKVRVHRFEWDRSDPNARTRTRQSREAGGNRSALARLTP